jgi:aspartyl-tRNA(Asn)/glutamyl-tRNA(Gln) amidotransferase subunit A
LALGTDGGGSIRTPAAHCGLLGLKPTAGRVARAHGLPVILSGREMASPLARSSADLAAMFRVIARPHPLDASSWAFADKPGEVYDPIPAYRILFFSSVGSYPVDPEITAALRDVADNLARLGHQITEGPAPFDVAQQQRAGQMGQAGLAWLLRDREWRGRIHAYYVAQAEAGMRLTAIDYVDAAAALRDVQGQIGEAFEQYDLLLSPVTVAPPGPADEPAPAHYGIFTGFANSAGVPAISIPATIGRAGLPIGFQLVGRFGMDWDLISIAQQYERHHPWLGRRPPL